MTERTRVADFHPPEKRRGSPIFSATAVVTAFCVAMLGRAPLARAADAEAERAARTHFRQGEAHYSAGHYADALAEYEAGYDVQPLPGFLVNIAQCQRRMGDLSRARATYGKFVLVAPDSPLVPEVRGLVEELDRLIAETEAARAQPSAAASDGASKATPGGTIPLGAGDGKGRRPDGAPKSSLTLSDAPLAPGADLTSAAATSDLAPPESEAAPSHRRWWLWGSLAAVAVGAASLGVVLSSSSPGVNTIHDGSIGTLRR